LGGTREGAGGIGGLLARTDHGQLTTGTGQPHAFYHADGNGNITALINDRQLIVARYTYDPFGNIVSKSGPLADVNTYRFSSQEYHQPSGLSLYLYRAYDPNLQRWINRDPIEEEGGINLYGFVGNDPVDEEDPFGLGVGNQIPEVLYFDPKTAQGSVGTCSWCSNPNAHGVEALKEGAMMAVPGPQEIALARLLARLEKIAVKCAAAAKAAKAAS
jgi:RHS repeat-associated protein